MATISDVQASFLAAIFANNNEGDIGMLTTILSVASDKAALMASVGVAFFRASLPVQQFLLDNGLNLETQFRRLSHGRFSTNSRDDGHVGNAMSYLMVVCTGLTGRKMFPTAQLLIQKKVDIRYENDAGRSALAFLVESGNADMKMGGGDMVDLQKTTKLLVENGATEPDLPSSQIDFLNRMLIQQGLKRLPSHTEQVLLDHFASGRVRNMVSVNREKICFKLKIVDGDIHLVYSPEK